MSTEAESVLWIHKRGLKRIDQKPDLWTYLRELYSLKTYMWEDARARRFSAAHGMFLGWVWTILNPLMDAAMYGFIFGVMLKTSRGIENFIGYVVIGVMFFSFLSAGLNSGANAIRTSKNLVTTFGLPFAVAPLSIAIRNFINGLTPALVAIIFALAAQGFRGISLSILAVIPLYCLINLFSAGLLLIVARVTAFLPDFKTLLSFINRAWFYTSGVFFSITRFTDNPTAIRIAESNPAYQFLQAVRESVLYGELPELSTMLKLLVISIAVFALGLVYFWLGEDRYAGIR